jgi:hypothetical protein
MADGSTNLPPLAVAADQENGQWQEAQETVYLITSLSPARASPQAILQTNRDHWGIESAPQAHTRRRFAMN